MNTKYIDSKEILKFARELKKADTSGVIGRSVQNRRTGYHRGQALMSIRIGEELEELVKNLVEKNFEKSGK